MKLYVFLLVALLTGCAQKAPEPPPKTQLEIREFQTRTFPVNDMKLVMKSMLNVLQDENFVVKNVALDLGFLTATKEVDLEGPSSRIWAQLSSTRHVRWRKNEIIEATCNVTEFGKEMRVRVNFQSKILDNAGAVMLIKQITDEQFYQDFFSKISKGIFIQEQNI